jgi:hypothetical protein
MAMLLLTCLLHGHVVNLPFSPIPFSPIGGHLLYVNQHATFILVKTQDNWSSPIECVCVCVCICVCMTERQESRTARSKEAKEINYSGSRCYGRLLPRPPLNTLRSQHSSRVHLAQAMSPETIK